MSQVGSNLRLSQLHPLRPSHTDQSQGLKLSQNHRQTDRQTEFPLVEVPQHFVLWDLKIFADNVRVRWLMCVYTSDDIVRAGSMLLFQQVTYICVWILVLTMLGWKANCYLPRWQMCVYTTGANNVWVESIPLFYKWTNVCEYWC